MPRNLNDIVHSRIVGLGTKNNEEFKISIKKCKAYTVAVRPVSAFIGTTFRMI
jgi:hypothetical protein